MVSSNFEQQDYDDCCKIIDMVQALEAGAASVTFDLSIWLEPKTLTLRDVPMLKREYNEMWQRLGNKMGLSQL